MHRSLGQVHETCQPQDASCVESDEEVHRSLLEAARRHKGSRKGQPGVLPRDPEDDAGLVRLQYATRPAAGLRALSRAR